MTTSNSIKVKPGADPTDLREIGVGPWFVGTCMRSYCSMKLAQAVKSGFSRNAEPCIGRFNLRIP
jgi:hypothetical protein